jgi:L-fucose isomerase-like protein
MVPLKRGHWFDDLGRKIKADITAAVSRLAPGEVQIVDVDSVMADGILYGTEGLDRVEQHLRKHDIAGLFMPHCDFGCEESVARLARSLPVPFLLWGPRDPAPDPATGERRTDTQCGLFASSKALQWVRRPFDYIENVPVGHPSFAEGFLRFCRVASIVRSLRGLRIAQIGNRPGGFLSCMCNESDLLSRFGVQVVPIPIASIIHRARLLADKGGDEFDGTLGALRSHVDVSAMKPDHMRLIAALRVELLGALRANDCRAAALECWSVMRETLGILPCYLNGDLAGEGIPVACETDVLGAVSMVMAQAAAMGREPTFFADFTQRHPDKENAELLWHCGPFPHKLKAVGASAKLVDSKGQWRLKDGEITMTRLDHANGKYCLMAGEGRTVEGPMSQGTYVWMEVKDWLAWERKLIHGPFIHHAAGVYGGYAQALLDSCKYLVPGDAAGVAPVDLDA